MREECLPDRMMAQALSTDARVQNGRVQADGNSGARHMSGKISFSVCRVDNVMVRSFASHCLEQSWASLGCGR